MSLKDLGKLIPSWSKKVVTLLLIGVVIFLFLKVRSCVKADEDVLYWRGVAAERAKETEGIKATLKEMERLRAKDKAEYENEINLKNGEITSLNGVIAGKMEEVYRKDAEIVKLKKDVGEMSPEVKRLVDAQDEEIFNLKSVIADKDKIIFEITGKYDKAESRIKSLEADITKYTKEVIPSLVSEIDGLKKLNKSVSTELAWMKTKSKGKTIITGAALFAAGYLALKK